MEPCTFCRGVVDPASGRCQRCGRVQAAQAPGAPLGQAAQMISCPACGAMMPPGARFCGNCRHLLASPGAAAPGSSPTTPAWGPGQQPGQSAPPSLPPVLPAPAARPRGLIQKIAALVLLVVVVVVGALGVGYALTRPRTQTGSATPTASTGAKATAPATSQTGAAKGSPPTLTFNSPASVDMDGLHIQTDGLVCPNELVLKQSQDTYDDAALQQMRAYVGPLSKATVYGNPNYPDSEDDEFFVLPSSVASTLPPVPNTLEWVPGGKTFVGHEECLGLLDFTDTSTASIQINSIGFTYDADSIANNFQYHLIDTCSIAPPEEAGVPCGPNGQGGGGPCYVAKFQLQGGAAGTQVQSPLEAGGFGPCPPTLTLDPTQPEAQTVKLTITSALAQELYRVRLTVSITTTQGTKVLTLPAAFTSTLAFADPSQFSCYGLQGNTFTPGAISFGCM